MKRGAQNSRKINFVSALEPSYIQSMTNELLNKQLLHIYTNTHTHTHVILHTLCLKRNSKWWTKWKMYNILHSSNSEKKKKETVTSISIIKSDVFMWEIDDFDSIQNQHSAHWIILLLPLAFFSLLCSNHSDSQWFFTVNDINRMAVLQIKSNSLFSTPVKMTMGFVFSLAVIHFAKKKKIIGKKV